MENYTEAHIKAQKKYDAKNIKNLTLRLNRKTDADILDQLSKQKNVQGYIKKLIRNDMDHS